MRVVGKPNKVSNKRVQCYTNERWHMVGTNNYQRDGKMDTYLRQYVKQKRNYDRIIKENSSYDWFMDE